MSASRFIQLVACHLFIVLLPCGCSRSHTEAQAEEHSEEGVTFKEGKGLRIPKGTSDFIGLKIVDVGEQKLASTLRFSAKVYSPSISGKTATESRTTLATGFVRKADVNRLQVGQSVKIQSDSDTAFSGKIIALNREMEKIIGQVEVLLEIDDTQKPLSMGNQVEVVVATGKEESIIGIPKSALLRTAEGNFVYTVSGEHLVRSEVKVGEITNEIVEIKDGLYAGDQIVVNPVMTLWMAELQSIRGGQACADGH